MLTCDAHWGWRSSRLCRRDAPPPPAVAVSCGICSSLCPTLLPVWMRTYTLQTASITALRHCTAVSFTRCFYRVMLRIGIVGGLEGLTPPQFMSTDAHFWVKIGFKLQSLGKILNISAANPPVLLGQFQCWWCYKRRARYCHGKSSVHPSVRPSATLRCRGHLSCNKLRPTSKIILWLFSYLQCSLCRPQHHGSTSRRSFRNSRWNRGRVDYRSHAASCCYLFMVSHSRPLLCSECK